MFEKVSRSLKYDSNIFFDHKHIYVYMDTTTDHFTQLALRVRGNNCEAFVIKFNCVLVLQLAATHSGGG